MSMNDTLAAAMSKIMNAERNAKKEILIFPASSILKNVLTVLQQEGYVGAFEEKLDERGNYLQLNLLGKINKCNSIKPRMAVKVADMARIEKRFLPAKNFGVLILSTPKGIITNEQAKQQNTGGKLLAFCY